MFEDWLRLFRQATGYSPEKLRGLTELAKDYGIDSTNVDCDALMFAIQTYYALILKLLAAEVVYLYGGGKLYSSYIAELEDAYMRSGLNGLRKVLEALESGGIFKQFGISNFLEGDYFSWYLDEIDSSLADVIAEIARRLSDFEPATPQLEPEFARDLLKRLYQHLVPKDIRHNLGEYYTPDWLADFLLDEVGLSRENLEKMGSEDLVKPLKIRVLDPACGSGTFLIRYIARLRDYAREHFLEDMLVDYLLSNVVGFDLNPLAVLTARTNYLLAIADLTRRGSIEIPIYLTDSLMVEKQSTLAGNVYQLNTVAGCFQIPASVVEIGLLSRILDDIVDLLRTRSPAEVFRSRMKSYDLSSGELEALEEFYGELLKLEEEGKDHVWIAIIRNAFAPILKGRFDYVVGNPPWVNWENLPEDFREMSKPLWKEYGMEKVISRGGFKKDLAMLFLARCFDLYLKEGGKLGFLMTFTAFKSQAGAGFREFLARKAKVHVVHDMVALYPFERATNRTSAVVVEKLCEVNLDKIQDDAKKKACAEALSKAFKDNVKGIKHVIWVPSGKTALTDEPLEEVLKKTIRHEVLMIPLEPKKPESPWMQVTPSVVEAVRKLLAGQQHYEAHAGVYAALNQVYFVQIRGKRPDGKLIITNPPEPGAKKVVEQVEVAVEPELVYPLIRGRDVKKWYVKFEDRYVILPHNPSTGKPYRNEEMREKFLSTFDYLNRYKEELKRRSIKPFLSLRDKIRKAKNEIEKKRAEKEVEKGLDENFYIVDNVGKYTFAPYKVVWKEIAGAITGKAVSFACAVVGPMEGKPVVPDHTVMLATADSPEEAYYVAGFLNSTIARAIIASYTYELRQETHVLDAIKVPKYDARNEVHKRIAELSKRAHELAKHIYSEARPDHRVVDTGEELRRVEREVDLAVAEMLGLTEDDLREFEKLMAMLSGKGLPVEEEAELPEATRTSV